MSHPNQPPQLPPLVQGQSIRSGPYSITVTKDMVLARERENRELRRRWELEERRRRRAEDQDPYFGEFKEFNVRRRFVRRVFSILTLQLLFTAAVNALVYIHDDVRALVLQNVGFLFISLLLFTFSYLLIVCSDSARRAVPCNLICLMLLTMSTSYLTAFATIHYEAEAILMAVGLTFLVILCITAITTCTKFDMTRHAGLLVIISLIFLLGIVSVMILMFFTHIPHLQLFIGLAGAFVFTLYLFFDLQTVMGGYTMELEPDEVVYATAQLYVDCVHLYRYLLLLLDN